jgi:hypothetical protein
VTLDRKLRVLFARALWGTGWSLPRAVRLLAGDGDTTLAPILGKRIQVFLDNLEQRMGSEGRGSITASLHGEYRANTPHITRVLEALEQNDIRSF